MKSKNSNRKTLLFAVAIVLFLLTASFSSWAQDQQFRAGDRVLASPMMLKDEKSYKPCTVIEFDKSAAAYKLECDGAEYYVSPTYVRAAKDATPAPEANAAPKTNPLPKNEQLNTNKERAKFKVGDRVLASPKMLKADKYYQPCTITSISPPNSYGMRCDPFNGISFEDYSVREDFIRAWPNATPAPKFDCSLDHPPDVNRKTAAASAAVFKRIIYEWQAVRESQTKVGVTFETFQIGAPFKNAYARNKNALLYEGFPQGATIYPIKTRFVMCVEGNEYNYRTVWDSGYACAKNRFGEWSCGADGGAARKLDSQNVPKNQ